MLLLYFLFCSVPAVLPVPGNWKKVAARQALEACGGVLHIYSAVFYTQCALGKCRIAKKQESSIQ